MLFGLLLFGMGDQPQIEETRFEKSAILENQKYGHL
jgi:hypothetical protein